jgi:hypothetical protein
MDLNAALLKIMADLELRALRAEAQVEDLTQQLAGKADAESPSLASR